MSCSGGSFLCDPEMEFQQMLLRVQESLSEDELQDLVFLCSDLLSPNKLRQGFSATELFSLLDTSDLLSPHNPSLLVELLTIMKQHSLIRKLYLDRYAENNGTAYISPYRRLLFELSQSINNEDLKNIKFMLMKTLPRRKLEKDVTLLQLFLEMEKEGLLNKNNLEILQGLIGHVYPALERRIIQYKTECEMFSVEEIENISSMSHTPAQPSSVTSLSSGDSMEEQVVRLSLEEGSGFSGDQGQHLENNSVIENESPNLSVPENPEILQYEMQGDRRGVCVIINNCNFRSLLKREGTDIDKESLEAVFQWLGFEVQTEQDCDRKRMLTVLKDLAARDHTGADCVVCCVLSHGYVDGVYGVDEGKVTFKELLEPLNPLQCPSLYQKPKLFFIQACRGTQEQRPVWPQTFTADDTTYSDAVADSIPQAADCLMAMSTVPDYVSFREKDKGTWFIQSLCDNLKRLVPGGVDLLTILTQVNHDVSRKTDRSGWKKQMPQPEFTLTKRVVFPVPETPPE